MVKWNHPINVLGGLCLVALLFMAHKSMVTREHVIDAREADDTEKQVHVIAAGNVGGGGGGGGASDKGPRLDEQRQREQREAYMAKQAALQKEQEAQRAQQAAQQAAVDGGGDDDDTHPGAEPVDDAPAAANAPAADAGAGAGGAAVVKADDAAPATPKKKDYANGWPSDLYPPVKKPDLWLSKDIPHCTLVDFKNKQVCGPMWILLGQRKCGTSSIWATVIQHPAMKKAKEKELHYFGPDYQKNKENLVPYFNKFPDLVAGRNVSVGEASPQYFSGAPDVPAQIMHELPNTKFIITLREPGERAWSDFKMMTRAGWINFDFTEAVIEEIAHNRKCMQDLKDGKYPNYKALKTKCYRSLGRPTLLQMGHYAEVIRWWYEFVPKEQILIFRAEDFYHDPIGIMDRITKFLDLPPYDWANAGLNFHKNQARAEIHMPNSTRALLDDYFRPLNDDLVDLLGEDYCFNCELPKPADEGKPPPRAMRGRAPTLPVDENGVAVVQHAVNNNKEVAPGVHDPRAPRAGLNTPKGGMIDMEAIKAEMLNRGRGPVGDGAPPRGRPVEVRPPSDPLVKDPPIPAPAGEVQAPPQPAADAAAVPPPVGGAGEAQAPPDPAVVAANAPPADGGVAAPVAPAAPAADANVASEAPADGGAAANAPQVGGDVEIAAENAVAAPDAGAVPEPVNAPVAEAANAPIPEAANAPIPEAAHAPAPEAANAPAAPVAVPEPVVDGGENPVEQAAVAAAPAADANALAPPVAEEVGAANAPDAGGDVAVVAPAEGEAQLAPGGAVDGGVDGGVDAAAQAAAPDVGVGGEAEPAAQLADETLEKYPSLDAVKPREGGDVPGGDVGGGVEGEGEEEDEGELAEDTLDDYPSLAVERDADAPASPAPVEG